MKCNWKFGIKVRGHGWAGIENGKLRFVRRGRSAKWFGNRTDAQKLAHAIKLAGFEGVYVNRVRVKDMPQKSKHRKEKPMKKNKDIVFAVWLPNEQKFAGWDNDSPASRAKPVDIEDMAVMETHKEGRTIKNNSRLSTATKGTRF